MIDLPNLDLNELKNLEHFSGLVPLFPLSSLVFFPNALLPLHIFEHRYRQMISDVINDEKIIGMVLFKPGWELNYHENPDIFDVVGIGRIVTSEILEDGKSNILLYGLKRARIIDIVKENPYRIARVEILENKYSGYEETYRKQIYELIENWNSMLDKKHKDHFIKIGKNLKLAHLTDALTSLLISNVFQKQQFLEETDVQKRAEMLISFLQTRLEIISITSRKRNEIIEKRGLN